MMNLVDALRVGNRPRLAFVGSGGKTTALFRLARTIESPVIVTSTTHLATDQLSLADHLIQIERGAGFGNISRKKIKDVTLITGPEIGNNRVEGVGDEIFKYILDLADAHGYPLLFEADGSRKLPLKAPAEHEPAIPSLESTGVTRDWLDGVVVVAGLSGLNKPLTAEWVHRPEHFADLSSLEPGGKINTDALGRVLVHQSGGLKNIPDQSRRILLLNQADTDNLQAQAQRLVIGTSGQNRVLSAYDAVVIASLAQDQISAVYESIAGIVLAAGESSRFGEPKQLLKWYGVPFVRQVASKALDVGLNPVIVVVGAYRSEVARAVEDLDVLVVENQSWKEGQSTSIKVGMEALTRKAGATLFLLTDQPQVSKELLIKLVETHAGSLSPIISPQIDGQRGNPVLFDRVTFPDLYGLKGDMGGRQLFSKYPITWVPWHDSSALLDVDTPEDYRKMVEMTSTLSIS